MRIAAASVAAAPEQMLLRSSTAPGEFSSFTPYEVAPTFRLSRPRICRALLKQYWLQRPCGENPLQFLSDAGYTGIIATNSEFEIERYPRVGDQITAETVFDSISDEKKTAMGNGFFVTWVTTYRDQNDEVIGRQWFRTLRFKTGAAPAGTAGD